MRIGKKSDILLMCVMIVIAALGASRTYLVCLLLLFVLLILSEKGGLAKKLRLILVLCLTSAAVVIVLSVFFSDTFAYFVSRFYVEDITTSRGNLMTQYNHFIETNPKVMLFGIGLQDFGHRLIDFYKVAGNTPHNSVQEIILAWGIPGLIIFAALFLNMYNVSSRRNRNISLLNWIPLIIILFKSFAGQLLVSPYTMLSLSFAYLSLCTDFLSPQKNLVYLPES